MDKRQPLLADEFLAETHKIGNTVVDPRIVQRIKSRLFSAKRFLMDEEATERAAQILRDIPDLLVREQQFARAPYDVTWIEFPFRKWWRTITDREPRIDADKTLGYLIDHDTVYVVAGDSERGAGLRTMLLPLSYRLHHPWSVPQQLEFANLASLSRRGLDGFLWGESIYKVARERPDLSRDDLFLHGGEGQRALRDHNTCSVLPLTPHSHTNRQELVTTMVDSSTGELKNIIGLLLLLNRPSVTTYARDVGRSKTFLRGRLTTYLSHTIVTISLDPLPIMRKLGTPEGEGVLRRRHEVRGTWCHNYEAREYARIAGCVHEWDVWIHEEDDPNNDPRHFVCKACGGKRWWRSEHERGTAQLGYVDKHYELKGEPA